MNPIVSVLMTSYNRQDYISKAIESVLASTLLDFELIIVDDCSSDKTTDIVEEFVKNDSRVKLYINDSNLGDYPNRNKAAGYAKGKYLKYVDADDMMYPYGLEYIVKYMESHPLADWGLTDINQDDNAIFPYLLQGSDIYKSHYFNVRNIFSKAPSSLVIKKSFYDSTKGFIEMNGVSDTEFFFRISLSSNLLLMPYGYMWCRGETLGSQSSIHYKNIALHALYDEIELYYLSLTRIESQQFNKIRMSNAKRRWKNYIKILLSGPNTLTTFQRLKKQLLNNINAKLSY
jgi:glycosyltransferase involved in cell wall biosynthesis